MRDVNTDSLSKLMEQNRIEEFRAVCRFIATADIHTLARIVEEIRCVHDNIIAFNFETKLLCNVDSVSTNGESIQLNLMQK